MKTLSIINPEQFAILSSALQIAAERYRENAKEFAKLVDHKPAPGDFMQIHGVGAQRMADQFTQQAEEASAFAAMFAAAEDVTVKYDSDAVDDDDAELLTGRGLRFERLA